MSSDAGVKLSMTAAAEKFFRRLLRFASRQDAAGVRLTVTPGGCSGYNSEFSAQAGPREGDTVVHLNGISLFLDAASCALLDGARIDFADTPTQTGLVFTTPRASSCGCASSASIGLGPTVAKVDARSIGRTTNKATAP